MTQIDVRPVGDAAVAVTLGDAIDFVTVRRVWSVAAALRARIGDSVLDIVPAYASILVRFDPLTTALAPVMAAVRGATEARAQWPDVKPRRLSVGACFGGENGIDLEEIAQAARLAPDEFIRRFCAAEYRVAFLGFVAGFPYLLGLPTELVSPRLATPRTRVPAGSIGIAGTQCGIYPRATPGGWRLIGRTAATVFEPALDPAALFLPGDAVRFRPERRIENTERATIRR